MKNIFYLLFLTAAMALIGVTAHESSHRETFYNHQCTEIQTFYFPDTHSNTLAYTQANCSNLTKTETQLLQTAQNSIEGSYAATFLYPVLGFIIWRQYLIMREIKKLKA